MNPCSVLDILQNEKRLSDLCPIQDFYSDTVFQTRDQMLGSVIKVAGVPFDTENPSVLNQYKTAWHQAILNLSDHFFIYVHQHRKKESAHLSGEFDSAFLQELDKRYHATFSNQHLFSNDIYITLVCKGIRVTGKKSMNWLFKGLSGAFLKREQDHWQGHQLDLLQKAVRQFMANLSVFSPVLVGSRDQAVGQSELMSFLSLFVNAGAQGVVHQPSAFSAYGADLNNNVQGKALPKRVALLAQHRVTFGDFIEFSTARHAQTRYAAMLSVKRYAPNTAPIMLDHFLQLDAEYILTNTFSFERKEEAQHRIDLQYRKMKTVDDPAKSQRLALKSLQDHVASDRLRMGYHHHTMMLIADDQAALSDHVAKAIAYYAEAGFVAIEESLGQEPAYWAQIPGGMGMIARSALLHSENFVDFCPLHNYRTGYVNQNHLGAAVTILKTISNTPYFFNFHAKGASDNPSKGHTTMIGGNGCGKTVMMAFLDAQVSRYGGRTFVFDRDRGLEIYLRACGGYYAVLSPEHANEIAFNPFQLKDTAGNRKFCRAWLSQLVKLPDESAVPVAIVSALSQCVDYAFDVLPEESRYLSRVVELLPVDFPRWIALRRWLRAAGGESDGEYAYLFDQPEDMFQKRAKMGFDMTHFLDQEPAEVLVVLMMYLFHQLESSFDGSLVTVLLDEGWQYLDNPYWRNKLKKWLPTLRKLNCHLVLATQSPSSVAGSSIRDMILDNVATQLYFPNPQAQAAHYVTGFNLTQAEFLCVKENHPETRHVLIKQNHASCLCQLDLSMMPDMLPILSASRETVTLLESILSKQGSDPEQWLPVFRKEVAAR